MGETRCIVVYGKSGWFMGMAESLRALTDTKVVYVDVLQRCSAAQVVSLMPDVIIVERGIWDWGLFHAFSDFPIIEIDAAQSILTVHSPRRVPAASFADLLQAIEGVTTAPAGGAV